jgi:hypothetical protein
MPKLVYAWRRHNSLSAIEIYEFANPATVVNGNLVEVTFVGYSTIGRGAI